MYVKPTEEQKEFAREWGWDEDQIERGYDVFDYDGTGLLEINRIDDIYCNTDVSDVDCAREAERTGFCKIIPVRELPKNFEYRYFGWIDTPENRERIKKYCENP